MGNCVNKNGGGPSRGGVDTEFETVVARAASDERLNDLQQVEDGDGTGKPVKLDSFSYPFENLVFADGGSTTIAYSGVVRVLEDVGIWDKIKRLAGCGVGALVAALLAVGYNSYHIERFLKHDIRKLVFDQTCSVTVLPSILRTYGWNSGDKLVAWFDSKMNEATAKTDITFAEIHQKFGRELCILVTNLSESSLEYCHPKTTPDMPIRIAIRMSLSIPGIFQPVSYKWFGRDDLFVDGSLLCKYPIHSYDGWWLSMEPEDCFVQRIPTISALAENVSPEKRFEGGNRHTLGILLYSSETKANYEWLMDGAGSAEIAKNPPNTALYRHYDDRHTCPSGDYDKLASAFNNLLELLKSRKLLKNKPITKEELSEALSNIAGSIDQTGSKQLTLDDLNVLFDGKTNADDIIAKLTSRKDQVTYPELCSYVDRRGLEMQQRQLGSSRRHDITSLTDYTMALHDIVGNHTHTVASASVKATTPAKHTDGERTLSVNTHYIRSTDFALDEADMNFLLELGQAAAVDYLHAFVSRRSVSLKSDNRKSYNREDLAYYIDDETSEIIDPADYSENLLRGVL